MAYEEGHGEALPGALGVPDDSAPLVDRLTGVDLPAPFQQALGQFVHGLELRVAADDLDGARAAPGLGGEIPDQGQQMCRSQHTGHQDVLVAQRRAAAPAGLLAYLLLGGGQGGPPGREAQRVGGDGAELGVVPVRSDQHLGEAYELRDGRRLGVHARIADDLLDRRVQRRTLFLPGGHQWGLALDDDPGQTVDEQDDVRNDGCGILAFHPELRDGEKVVAVLELTVPVDESDVFGLALGPAGDGPGVDPLTQEIGRVQVARDAPSRASESRRRALDPGEEVIQLGVGQPGLAVGARVDPSHRVPEPLCVDDLLEALPPGRARLGNRAVRRAAFEVRPPHGGQLTGQRLLGLVVLRLPHAWSPRAPVTVRPTRTRMGVRGTLPAGAGSTRAEGGAAEWGQGSAGERQLEPDGLAARAQLPFPYGTAAPAVGDEFEDGHAPPCFGLRADGRPVGLGQIRAQVPDADSEHGVPPLESYTGGALSVPYGIGGQLGGQQLCAIAEFGQLVRPEDGPEGGAGNAGAARISGEDEFVAPGAA